jgi:hypothetical protein
VALIALLWPTITLPKFRVAGETVSWPTLAPVPDRVTVKFGFEASETNPMLPLTLPADVGAKFTPNVKLCPGFRVRGKASPVMLNPVPVLTLAWLIFTAVPPEFVRLSVLLAVLLTATLPKLREEDVTPSTPGVVPLPDRETSRVEFEASLRTEIFPLADPPDCGLKLTLKLAL